VFGPDGRVVAVEALVRWARPGGIILPSEFLPGLERAGLDLPLGEWVLQQALADASRWAAGPLPGVPVIVNVSPTQLASPGLAGAVEEGLGRSGASGLVIETAPRPEDVDLRGLVGVLDELRGAGARLSLDRVDRSAISAGLLTALPFVDTVKLDRSVVADLQGTGRATAAALRILADRVGTSLGATGVETAAELENLRALGVQVVQGYRFCPPVALQDLSGRMSGLVASPPAEPSAFVPPDRDEVEAILPA
jgi:EAL domain-containing protein (putative c-di-GMP-specific phosphodiesterase class I)